MAYAVYKVFYLERAWLVAVVAPVAATAVFLLLAGAGYLRMLKLFARGIANFIVEPLPYILVFLFALVWLVPLMLARSFRDAPPEGPLLASLYVFSVALLPGGLWKSRSWSRIFRGIQYLPSSPLVAISGMRPGPQFAWITFVILVLTWTAFVDGRFYWPVLEGRIRYDTSHWQDDRMMRAAHAFMQKVAPAVDQSNFFSLGARNYSEYGAL